MADENTGNQATITFAPWSTFSPKVLSIKPSSKTVDVLDNDDLSTTGAMPKVAADITNQGEIEVGVRFGGDLGDLAVPATGTATIKWPQVGTNAAKQVAGSAICTALDPQELNNQDRPTANITLMPDGVTEMAYT